MNDYYGYHPTTALDRPLVLVGCFGAGASRVAYGLCARTGLAFVDIDREVEHAAGCSLAALFLRSGEARYRELARAALDQALRRRPPPVLVLGTETLQDPLCRRRVLDEAMLVYLRAGADELARRMQAQLAEQPTRCFPFIADAAAARPERLAELLAERRDGYEAAGLVLDIDGLHAHTLVLALQERLGL